MKQISNQSQIGIRSFSDAYEKAKEKENPRIQVFNRSDPSINDKKLE